MILNNDLKENNQLSQKDFNYCYDPYRKQFLDSIGIKYIFKNTHYKTHKIFWVYMKGDELNNALTKWYSNNK